MNKRTVVGFLIVALAISFCFYLFMPTKLVGKSKDKIWKVTYTEVNDPSFSDEGIVGVKQLTKEKVTVKKIAFYKNNEKVVETDYFRNERDIDGTVYKLNPFSYPDLYRGKAPDKDNSYYVKVEWENDSEDKFSEKISLK